MTELTGLLRLAARVLLAAAEDVLFAVVPNTVPQSWVDAESEWLWDEL